MQIVPLLPANVKTTHQFCFNSEAAKLYEAIAYRVCLRSAGARGACVALGEAGKVDARVNPDVFWFQR
jgi:hypothetical protein